MLAALNNITTADGYTLANTLPCEGAVKLNIEVSGAAIFYRYAIRDSLHPTGWAGATSNFGPEVFKGPNTYLLSRNADAVQVRSAVPGKPAQVTIEALGPGE